MWSEDPTVQAGLEAAGVHGQISPESLLCPSSTGAATSWTGSRRWRPTSLSSGSWRRLRGGARHHRHEPGARVRGRPRYVVGPYPGSGLEGEYLGLVTLNLPAGARNSRFDGVDPLAVSGADGENRTIAAWVQVPRGTTTHLVARFQLPAAMVDLVIEPSAARPDGGRSGQGVEGQGAAHAPAQITPGIGSPTVLRPPEEAGSCLDHHRRNPVG